MAKRWRRKARKQARKYENLVVKERIEQSPRNPKHDWKEEIKKDQNYICAVCGKPGTSGTLDIHHCVNRCRKGKNTKENCCAVHKRPCHVWIHATYGNEYYDPRKK